MTQLPLRWKADGPGRSESHPAGQTSLQRQNQPGACMSILSKLHGVEPRLSPPLTGVHVYTSTFSAHVSSTRPFFTLSNRGHQAAPALCSQHWPQSLLQLSTPDLLGTTGSSTLHNDIPTTTSRKFQPALLIVTSRTMGPLALSVIVSHFLGRGKLFSTICLGLCKWHFRVPMHLESLSQWDMQRRLNISGLVSLFISNSGA